MTAQSSGNLPTSNFYHIKTHPFSSSLNCRLEYCQIRLQKLLSRRQHVSLREHSSPSQSASAIAKACAYQHKTLDVITLFHKARSPASARVVTLLKQASAAAATGATEDQASDHTHQTNKQREEFELNITEDPPTEDQVKTILEYLGPNKISSVFRDVQSNDDALRKFKSNPRLLPETSGTSRLFP